MAVSVAKVAPSAVVLAFVGYCSWPSVYALLSPPPPPPPPPAVTPLAASLFSPQLPPPPMKSPWGGLDATALAAMRGATRSETAGGKAAAKVVDPLDNLRLEATCILGEQRIAMINGQLYGPQPIPGVTTATNAFKVLKVSPEKVLLESKGRRVELTYEGLSRPTRPAKAKSSKSLPAKSEGPKSALTSNPSGDPGRATPPQYTKINPTAQSGNAPRSPAEAGN